MRRTTNGLFEVVQARGRGKMRRSQASPFFRPSNKRALR
jgi:hypothetical protein